GSRIDWSSRIVGHFNMGSNKVIGLADALGTGEEALRAGISFVFGDDPLGNDRELLKIAPYAYVIKNEKNRHLNLPERVRLVTWSEVQAMSISELASLHTDPGEEVDPSHCLVAHRTWVKLHRTEFLGDVTVASVSIQSQQARVPDLLLFHSQVEADQRMWSATSNLGLRIADRKSA